MHRYCRNQNKWVGLCDKDKMQNAFCIRRLVYFSQGCFCTTGLNANKLSTSRLVKVFHATVYVIAKKYRNYIEDNGNQLIVLEVC